MSVSDEFALHFLPTYFVSFIGILSNTMLLVALVKDPLKCFRNSATYLIGNLALSDLIYNCVITPRKAFEFFVVLQFLSLYSSMGTIFSIAIDRYHMVCLPFKHRSVMNGRKMAFWIGIVWLLSSVHPLKRIVVRSESDFLAQPIITFTFILLSAILYGKTYYTLKTQARAILGKKSTFFPRQSDFETNKSISKDAENCINQAGQFKNESSSENSHSFASAGYGEFKNSRAGNEIYRAGNLHGRAQSENERAHSAGEFAVKKYDISEDQNKRDESNSKRAHSCDQSAKSHYERAEDHSECDQNQDERAHEVRVQTRGERIRNLVNRDKRDVIHKERDQNQDERAHDERVQTQDERVQNQINRARNENDNCDNLTRDITGITQNSSSQNLPTKRRQYSQTINNAKEQKFLNTIIIITFLAVITVVPGSIFYQFWHKYAHDNRNGPGIVKAVVETLFCFNFALNPFIYCWRLERYRRTFKILLKCKS
ncbi:muscarinic acetylcholine receptor M3-like [Dendronephthya gigantea]|uniref:muscarinic acetylcholine receptor M3-like n=1 Tax=Dendronephthya gigantea TaxID=151771 RepID=UPI00106BEDAB|nr:muscarinic acetylcholine receptor M3-like [Dendronephthya gigantea]